MVEKWKKIPDFDGASASNMGRIKDSNGNFPKVEHNRNGRDRVIIDGHREWVHRLVCLAWRGTPPDDGRVYFVDHIDGNPRNNMPTNLEWVTPAENARRAGEKGLLSSGGGKAKPCFAIKVGDSTGRIFKSRQEASDTLGINAKDVSKACTRLDRDSAHGYIFFDIAGGTV